MEGYEQGTSGYQEEVRLCPEFPACSLGKQLCVAQDEPISPSPPTLFLVSTFARNMESEGIMDVGPKQMAWARIPLFCEVA